MAARDVIARLQQTPAQNTKLRRSDFNTQNGAAQQRNLVASYKAKVPLLVRPETALRLAFVTVEEFSTDNTADNTETFNLDNQIIETPNTRDLALFKNGERVQPDSVDYDGDSFDFTDPDTGSTLHAYYVFGSPAQISLERHAPRSQGRVSDVIFDDATSLLHPRNQNQEPVTVAGDGSPSVMDLVVPRNFELRVYAQSDVDGLEVAYNDSDTNSPQDTEAPNALLSVPVRKAQNDIQGLADLTKRSIIADS